MNSICLATIRDDVYDDMDIIPVPMLERLFSIGKTRTPEEVFYKRVQKALLTFERYYPYKTTLKLPKVQCSTNLIEGSWVDTYFGETSDNVIVFYDNTEQVFFNLIDEKDLQMIPLAVKRLQHNLTVSHPSDFRQFDYQKPKLIGPGVRSYEYFSGLFKYPVIWDKRNSDVLKLENCWLLLMYYGDDVYRTFRAQVVSTLCEYLMNLKDNFELPGLPINVFNAIPKIKDEADKLLQTEYSQAQVSWGWD